jgi:hypothetical protein
VVTRLSQLIQRFRAQPPLVRAFICVLTVVLLLRGLDGMIDVYHGFSRGLADGIQGAKFAP